MEDVIVISESDDSDGGRNFDNTEDGDVQFADASFEKSSVTYGRTPWQGDDRFVATGSEDGSDDSLFQDDLREATRRSLIETHRSNGGEEIIASEDRMQRSKQNSNNGNPKTSLVKIESSETKPSLSSEIASNLQFLNGDKLLPIYDVRNNGYTYSEAVRILLSCDKSRICTKQPILVEENYSFVISLKCLEDPDDIKSDDSGHWIHNGRKTTCVSVWHKNGSVSNVKSIPKLINPDENSQVYSLVRTYYVHDPHHDFKRIFYHLFGVDKIRHDLCLVQYYFDGETHVIHPRSHGNSKTVKPYARSKKSLHDKLKRSGGKATPKQALTESLLTCGGVLGADSVGSIPKSRSQVRYHQSKNKQISASDPLFTVMMQCKSTESNSDEAFVRSVVAAPEPMAVLATNRQLDDMIRFLTNPVQHAVMGVDPTFNFGEFNVTPIAFRYLLLEHKKLGHSPIILGPLLVHQQKKFSSYHFFISTLISLCPSLKNIKAFGSDGEVELYRAFKLQLPNAIHLRCFRHFRSNLAAKLSSLGMPSATIKEFMKDVFGQTIEGVHEVGLVDARSRDDFDEKLKALHAQWDKREILDAPHRQPLFFKWFLREKAGDIKDSMLLSLREAAGLGNPPSPFYTNTSESLNSMLHEKVRYKKSEWPKFNEAMKALINESYELVELSIIDHGDFKFRPQYEHLAVPQRRWFQMTLQQRRHHLSKVASALLTESSSRTLRITDFCHNELPETEEPEAQVLSLSVQDVGINSLPKPVLDGIWNKAEKLLSEPGQVMEGPGTSSSVTTCYVVRSASSDRPHIVKHSSKSGQFLCESSCPMWQSSKICSHCVAAAQFSGNLKKFVEWYKVSKSKPNLSKLAQIDMPKGTGRKGEKPPRKRKKSTSVYYTLVDDNSTITTEQEIASSSSPAITSSGSVTSDSHTPCGSVTPNSHAQNVEWNWSATPSHVTATTSFPPVNPWMCMAPHMQPINHPQHLSNDFQSWPGSLSSPMPVFPMNSGTFPSCVYYPWTSPCSIPSAQSLVVPRPVTPTHNLAGTKKSLPESSYPFVVRFIAGNIRMCQGCKSSVRLLDGSIPSPPHDIVVARLEQRQYFDKKSGEWCYSSKSSNCHYHARLSCIVQVEPLFIPSSLQVPVELKQNLLEVHREYLSNEFGIAV